MHRLAHLWNKSSIMQTVLFALLGLGLSMTTHAAGKLPPDLFGIYVSDLSGSFVKPVLINTRQQMSHPRVSPDGQWMTFTRYNKTNLQGLAMEENGYENTEIMLARLDGSQLKTVITAKPGILNCNSSWAPDGRSLIWLSTDNPQHLAQLMRIELATGNITRIPTPAGLNTSDPHASGTQIVFPVVSPQLDVLWLMQLDGSNPRQLTFPHYPKKLPHGKHPPGDYDPKLSPDGTQVAFMRLYGKNGWRVFTVDVATGREHDLSGPDNIEGLPDWSSDGKRLLFVHYDLGSKTPTKLFTMRPDGSDRQAIPLPPGYVHGHPHFFPGAREATQAKIIFQAIHAPQLLK